MSEKRTLRCGKLKSSRKRAAVAAGCQLTCRKIPAPDGSNRHLIFESCLSGVCGLGNQSAERETSAAASAHGPGERRIVKQG
jgi:hypothetical protein